MVSQTVNVQLLPNRISMRTAFHELRALLLERWTLVVVIEVARCGLSMRIIRRKLYVFGIVPVWAFAADGFLVGLGI